MAQYTHQEYIYGAKTCWYCGEKLEKGFVYCHSKCGKKAFKELLQKQKKYEKLIKIN